MAGTFLAARVGARVSHTPAMTSTSSPGVLGAVLGGSVVGPAGLGGVATVSVSAGIGCGGAGGAPISLGDMIPMLAHGVLVAGAAGLAFGAGVVPVPAGGPPLVCSVHANAGPQLVMQGSGTVSAGGQPIARASDTLTCGAVICDGIPGVAIGGPPAPTASPPSKSPSLAGPLGGVALGAVLSQTGAAALVTDLGRALTGALDTVEHTVDKVATTVEKTLDKVTATVDKVATGVESGVNRVAGAVEAGISMGEQAVSSVLGGLFGGSL